MAKKSPTRVDDLIEPLTDDRVTSDFLSNLQDKIQKCTNDQLEKKLNEFTI